MTSKSKPSLVELGYECIEEIQKAFDGMDIQWDRDNHWLAEPLKREIASNLRRLKILLSKFQDVKAALVSDAQTGSTDAIDLLHIKDLVKRGNGGPADCVHRLLEAGVGIEVEYDAFNGEKYSDELAKNPYFFSDTTYTFQKREDMETGKIYLSIVKRSETN
jgi:hypothetical protein